MNKAEYQDFDQELIGLKVVIMVNILTLHEIYIEYTQKIFAMIWLRINLRNLILGLVHFKLTVSRTYISKIISFVQILSIFGRFEKGTHPEI